MMAGPVFVYLQWPTLASAMGGDECKLQRREFQVGEARVSVMAVIIRVACGLGALGSPAPGLCLVSSSPEILCLRRLIRPRPSPKIFCSS